MTDDERLAHLHDPVVCPLCSRRWSRTAPTPGEEARHAAALRVAEARHRVGFTTAPTSEEQ